MRMSRLDQFQGQQVVSGKSDLPAPRLRVALLTNFIPPYLLPVLRGLSSKVADLHVFISTAMEADRFWAVDWTGLQVTVQKTMTTGVRRKHPIGYSVPGYLHFSYDTIPLLSRYKPNVVISSQLGPRTMQSFLYCKMSQDARLITWADLSEQSECGTGKARSAIRRILLQSSDAILVKGGGGPRFVKRWGAGGRAFFGVPLGGNMTGLIPL